MRRFLTWKNFARFSNQNTLETNNVSSQKPNKGAIEAVWAQAIFDQIKNASSRNFDQGKTLVDHLRSYLLPSQSAQKLGKLGISQEDIENTRKEMIKIFDPLEGVAFPELIFNSQHRFTSGSIEKTQNQLTFYPNTFVTSPVFEILDSNFKKANKNMIVGKQGISKSMSLLLAWHLSNITTRFRLRNPSKVAQLVKNNLLKAKFSKIIYISFRNSGKNMDYYSEVLKCQLPESSGGQPETPKTFINPIVETIKTPIEAKLHLENLATNLAGVYKANNIRCLVVMDQINTLANRFHDYNLKLKAIAEEKEIDKASLPAVQKIINSQLFAQVNQQKTFYDVIQSQNHFDILFNSSSNIQSYLFHKPSKLDFIPFALNAQHHSPIIKIYCDYDKSNDQNKKQLYRFIWYQLCKSLSLQERNQFEKYFIEACDNQALKCRELCSLMTPLSIKAGVKKLKPSLSQVHTLISSFNESLCNILQNKKDGSSQLEKSVNNFVREKFNELDFHRQEKQIQKRFIQFVEAQAYANFFSDEVYLRQEIKKFFENTSGENKQILKKWEKLIEDGEIINSEQLQKLKEKINENINLIVNKEIKLRDQDKRMLPFKETQKQVKARLRDFLSTIRSQVCGLVGILMLKESCIESKRNYPSYGQKVVSNLISQLEVVLEHMKLAEKKKRLQIRLKKLVEDEIKINNSSQKQQQALISSILELSKTWEHQSSWELRMKKVASFSKDQLSIGNLPTLEYQIKSSIKDLVQKICDQIEGQGIQLIRTKTTKFLKSEDDPSIKSYRYAMAFDCAAYYHQHKNSPFFKSIPLLAFNNVSVDIVKEYYDRELFKYNNETKALDLKVSKKQLEAVSLTWIFKNFGFPSDNIIYKGALAGMMIELYVMLWLQKNPVCTLATEYQKFPAEAFKDFLHFKSTSQKKNMRHNLTQLLDEAQKNAGVWCIGRPLTAEKFKKRDEIQPDTSPNSPKFDLLLLRYQKKKFQITTIDFTVNQDQRTINDKKSGALRLIKELLQYNYEYMFDQVGSLSISNWTHIVACRKQLAFKEQSDIIWDYDELTQSKKLLQKNEDLKKAKQELEKAKKKESEKTEEQRQAEAKKKANAKGKRKGGAKAQIEIKTEVEIKSENVQNKKTSIENYQVWIKKVKELKEKNSTLLNTSITLIPRDICKIELIKEESLQSPMSRLFNSRFKKLQQNLNEKTKQ